MLTVTETASARLGELLSESPDGEVMRIVRLNRRARMRRDRARPDDTTFSHNGRVVLVLDGPVATALAARTLDLRQAPTGPRLRLRAR